MSHACCFVIVPPNTSMNEAQELVEAAMAPHSEHVNDDGFWDWWQIGGRWSGLLSEYDPREDPVNMETCELCGGTGVRPGGRERFGEAWFEGCNGCNGCSGKGQRLLWPTQWAAHPGDVAPVAYALNSGSLPFSVVANGTVAHNEVWSGKDFVPHPNDVRELLEAHREDWCVVVDYHS